MSSTSGDCELKFDVVVIGGGPAGAAAGMTLLQRDDVSVAIVEKSDYAIPRIGESLSPGVRPLLEYLDVWEQFRVEQSLASYGSRAAWGSASAKTLDYMFTLHGAGWCLDRVRFDRMLIDAFRGRGGTVLTETRFVSCQRVPSGGWEVRMKSLGERTEAIRCRYLIDATGRRGQLARQLGIVRVMHDQLVGIGCIGQLPSDHSLESLIQIEACSYGWWYTAPIPGDRISVVLMSDTDIVRQRHAARSDRWRSLLDRMALTSERVRGTEFHNDPRAFSSVSSCLQQVGGEGWVAVGDAGASHDPLSSTGIPHALGSGVHGAIVAADFLFAGGDLLGSYQQSVHENFSQYLRTRWQYYQRETRWSGSPFWKRRTTPVFIDPHVTIEHAETPNEVASSELVHLPTRLAKRLYRGCQTGRSAHQVIREFADGHPEIPDQKIILAFQEFVDCGYLKVVGAAATL